MNIKTLKALEGSIKKWKKIVAGTEKDKSTTNCPLCQEFKNCKGCPVNLKTHSSCEDSPYDKWVDHQDTFHLEKDDKVHCPTCKKLAQEELNFLKSLLPERGEK